MPCRTWQARCRIEKDLLDNGLPTLLAESGLQELRLGLESGSTSVLRSMNKFDEEFSFDLVEKICQEYTSNGISIHFPMIIGFPGETVVDRHATYELLQRLSKKYRGVTYNINLFGLDVASKVFRHWRERDQFMRKELFPWMPIHSLTPPHILYRLSETIRNTLLWKKQSLWSIARKENDRSVTKVQTGDLTLLHDPQKDLTYVYNWDSHHYLMGNSTLVDVIRAFSKPKTPDNFLDTFCNSAGYTRDDLQLLVDRLIYDLYLIPVEG